MIDAGTLEEDDLPDETGDCLEEALHQGPEPGGADLSEPTSEQLQAALEGETAVHDHSMLAASRAQA